MARKTLIQSLAIDLSGQVEEITTTEFRAAPGDIFLQLKMGKTFVIRHYGQVIGKLVPSTHVQPTERTI